MKKETGPEIWARCVVEGQQDLAKVRSALDLLALALAHEEHIWTDEERKAYNAACRILSGKTT